MGNGLFNSPPPIGGDSLPDIPVTNFVQQAKDDTQGKKESHWYDWLWKAFWEWVPEGIGFVIGILVSIIDEMIAKALTVVQNMQGINQAGMIDLMQSVLGDLLGLEFERDEFIASWTKGGRLGTMQTAGGKLFDVLNREFTGGATSGPIAASADPAKRFIGFLIEFAVREGNLSVISELIPEEFNFMGGLREYGENVARYMGLGRLARQALRPLIQTLVADPLHSQLNYQYRPARIGATEVVRSYFRGAIGNAEKLDRLAHLGFTDAEAALFELDASRNFSADELYLFWKYQGGGGGAPIAALQRLGLSPTEAQNLWNITLDSHVETLQERYLHELLTQFRSGNLDSATLQGLLSQVTLTPDEQKWWQLIYSQAVAVPRKQLTESELETAYLEGIIDLSQIQGSWAQRGFSPDSIQVLTFLLLAKQKKGTKTATGHAPHKVLTDAQLEKALKDGLMTAQAVSTYLIGLGYSATDAAILLELFSATKPGTTTPATPA